MTGRAVVLAPGLAGLALLAAGCGGGSKTPAVASLGTTTSAGSTSSRSSTSDAGSTARAGGSYVAFAHCMTSHGIATAAQPNGGVQIAADGVDRNSPQLQAAQKACQALLPKARSDRPPITEATKRALLGFAACMRKHGLTNWPDPIFPPGGGIMGGNGPHYDPQAPAVKQAVAACNEAMRRGRTS